MTTSFDKAFCEIVEYHLSKTLQQSKDKKIRWLGCDGVQMPDDLSQLSDRSILESKKIITKAWFGKDGQDIYEMVVHFGDEATKQFLSNGPLEMSLPSQESTDWIVIDVTNKLVEIQLN